MRGWLKEARTERWLTLKDVAENLDITESYYCMIENGERQRKMDIVLARKLSDLFSIPLQKISELEDE